MCVYVYVCVCVYVHECTAGVETATEKWGAKCLLTIQVTSIQ